LADEKLLEKYGDLRNIKYLINSLDDLKDVTDTIIYMIRSNCEIDDFDSVLDCLGFRVAPINSSQSSFIFSLNFPVRFLEAQENKPSHVLD
jgi:hypothetical protein